MSVFWFKLNVSFDKDDRVLLLEKQRNGKLAVYIYFKLYFIAARCNQMGGIFIAENRPHTAKTLAKQWDFKVSQVENSLNLLLDAGLLEVIENVFFISDWDETQSIDKLEEIRKNARLRKQKSRERQRARKADMSRDSHVTSQNRIDIEIDKEKDIDGDGDIDKKRLTATNGNRL